jgi:hypothetical protein
MEMAGLSPPFFVFGPSSPLLPALRNLHGRYPAGFVKKREFPVDIRVRASQKHATWQAVI